MKWSDLKTYVSAELAYEGNTISDDTLVELANQAVDIISEVVRPLPYELTLASLDRDGDAYVLPADAIGPVVATDGDFLIPVLPRDAYVRRGGLSSGPAMCAVGRRVWYSEDDASEVKLYLFKALPVYVKNNDAVKPMDPLPRRFQRLPAFYVLSQFRAGADVAPEVARVQKFTALWQDGLAAAAAACRNLHSGEFRF